MTAEEVGEDLHGTLAQQKLMMNLAVLLTTRSSTTEELPVARLRIYRQQQHRWVIAKFREHQQQRKMIAEEEKLYRH